MNGKRIAMETLLIFAVCACVSIIAALLKEPTFVLQNELMKAGVYAMMYGVGISFARWMRIRRARK